MYAIGKRRMEIYDKIIIGAGASGMVAAIESARAGQSVLVLERMEKVGKKIFATGNGKCNMTNLYWNEKCYHSDQIDFVRESLERFGPYDTISFFRGLGLMTMEKNGYVYPNSQQAVNVVETLLYEMERLGVEIKVNTEVKNIKKEGDIFYIEIEKRQKEEAKQRGNQKESQKNKQRENQKYNQEEKQGKRQNYRAKKIILASGGKASEKLGSNGSGYELAKRMGHHLIPVVPALTSLKTKNSKIILAAGVRCNAAITLKIDGKVIKKEEGELQITSYGISGILVFQVSRFVANAVRQKKKVTVELDFFPDWEMEKLKSELWDARCLAPNKTMENWLFGFLNRNLVFAILKEKDFSIKKTCDRITKDFVSLIASTLKCFEIEIEDTNDFSNAQVCAGGVKLSEITQNFESKFVKGLYLVGELLDVDGICGGYNLQWAFTSGYLSSHCQSDGNIRNNNIGNNNIKSNNIRSDDVKDNIRSNNTKNNKIRSNNIKNNNIKNNNIKNNNIKNNTKNRKQKEIANSMKKSSKIKKKLRRKTR